MVLKVFSGTLESVYRNAIQHILDLGSISVWDVRFVSPNC